jgi:hypothetical protein
MTNENPARSGMPFSGNRLNSDGLGFMYLPAFMDWYPHRVISGHLSGRRTVTVRGDGGLKSCGRFN